MMEREVIKIKKKEDGYYFFKKRATFFPSSFKYNIRMRG